MKALEERIADIDGMLSDVNDSDNSSKASMEQEFAKVREEMICRDQLLKVKLWMPMHSFRKRHRPLCLLQKTILLPFKIR